MKRLILILVLTLHSIRFYNDYKSISALTFVSAAKSNENTFFSSTRYYQFEKGKLFSLQLFIEFHYLCFERLKKHFVFWFYLLLTRKRYIQWWRTIYIEKKQRRSSRLGKNLNKFQCIWLKCHMILFVKKSC